MKRRDDVYAASWGAYRKADIDLRDHLLEMTGNALLADHGDPEAAATAAARHMDNAVRVLRFLLQVVVVER